jgi:hypothetical protein
MKGKNMSYVYCGYCGQRGHNKLGCPKRKAEARANPEGYLARQIAREQEIRKKAVESRKCTYCNEPGHNRRGCSVLKEDRKLILKRQAEYLQDFLSSCQQVGFGPGTLVRIPHGSNDDPFSKQVLALVTNFHWQEIDFLNADMDQRQTWGVRNRTIAEARVVATEGYDDDTYWGGPPEHNAKITINQEALNNVLAADVISPGTEHRTPLQIVGPASASFVVPESIITRMVNDTFNLVPAKNAKDWEKGRRSLHQSEWSRVRPKEHDEYKTAKSE